MIVRAAPDIALPQDVLDQLMPLHLLVASSGHVRHAGPTLVRLMGRKGLIGRPFLDCFELRRPRGVRGIADLAAAGGTKLSLRLRNPHCTDLKGHALPLPGDGGLVVNLAFGISAVEAVGTYALTAGDFAPTDLTVELLYLVEAQEAVLDESRSLNRRLVGAKIAAEEQAFTDTLTGVKNRRAMEHILSRLAEMREPTAVMHLDLDWFKAVNDTHGHAAGDHVLQVAARILVDETRADDTVIRAGGDEFVLIFPRLTDPERLAAIAARILRRLDAPIRYQGARCRISASIGIAMTGKPEPGTVADLVDRADAALYRAKNAGRGRYRFADDPAEMTGYPASASERRGKGVAPGASPRP